LVLDAAEGDRRRLTAGVVQPGDRSTFCIFWVWNKRSNWRIQCVGNKWS